MKKSKLPYNNSWIVVLLLALWACDNSPILQPKPRGYPKVVFPERSSQIFTFDECEFTFDFPTYTEIEFSKKFFDETPVHPCWFDIHYPSFNARIHFSYLPITERDDFDTYISDAYRIAQQINLRSNYMDDYTFINPQGIEGIVMDFEGPAASPMHFILTDTTKHFVKGAFYFETQLNIDSLAPMTAFIEEDLLALIASFQWKE